MSVLGTHQLITQLLMVSTRNTSRSEANPSRMQDPPGDTDSRPPGALETMQANAEEMEALRLTNQRLIEELEQLTRQIQRPREARQTQEGHNIPPHEGQHNLDTPQGVEIEAESSRARGHEPHLTKNYATLSKGRESNHGSRGSRASSKSSAV